jgi:hypothetical protein
MAAPIKMVIHVKRRCADTQSELVSSDSVIGHGPFREAYYAEPFPDAKSYGNEK